MGWKFNEFLPEGWTCKPLISGTSIMLKSLEGFKFSSYKTAAAFMKENEKYTDEDVKKLFLYPNGKSKKEKAEIAKWKKSQYLPEGWTCQKVKVDSDALSIKADCGKIFNNRFDASLFMSTNGKYTQDDIEMFYLYPDGNNHNPQRVEEKLESLTADGEVDENTTIAESQSSKMGKK